jgi:NADH dehydrogenase
MSQDTASPDIQVVTGAFGFTGRHIAARLLNMGKLVRTLTNHPPAAAAEVAIRTFPLRFDDFPLLVESLRGASVLYNTYWVRYPRGDVTFEGAVANTRLLMRAARQAGVRRVVHVSVSNAATDSPLPYFRGKARAEAAVEASGISYAILRPTVLYGDEGLLINNIAYFLRRVPVFPVFGSGRCRIQPVFVEDVADAAVVAGGQERDLVMDVAGPDTYDYIELLRLIRRYVGGVAILAPSPTIVSLIGTRVLGALFRDVILTHEEVKALKSNLLVSKEPPLGKTRFESWLIENSRWLGTRYMSDLAKRESLTVQRREPLV